MSGRKLKKSHNGGNDGRGSETPAYKKRQKLRTGGRWSGADFARKYGKR